jgi:DNA repair protein RadD
MIELRDYQQKMIAGARESLKRVRSILMQAPTGAGKTVLASFMIGQTAARGQAAWFICHRAELVEGTSNTFRKFGISHGLIAAGSPMNLRELVQVCSIDTLKGRLATLVPPKLAILDEGHHSAAKGWALVISWLKEHGTIVVLLSATPQRLDGQGLREFADELVPGPSTAWLIENGHLAKYLAFIPDVPDMKGVKRHMGDFSKSETAEKMDKPKLTGNIIAHWKKYASGMRSVGFGVNVAHSQHLAESFCQAGIQAAHLDGGTDKTERKRIIQQFAAGEVLVLFNVSLFGEGFDLSAVAQTDVTIDCVIDAAPTQSLSLAMQRWGRALRPSPGKTAILLDHAGNMMRHGFPDDEREWSLDGREKGKAANDNGPPPPVICEGCFNAIRRPLPPACPHCGKSMQAKQREIEVAEGELKAATERDKESVRQKLKREEAKAKDISELAAIFAKRGVPNPMGRAVVEFGSRRYKRR